MNLFCSMLLNITRQAQRLEHLWPVICHIPPPLSRSVLVVDVQLPWQSAPLTVSLRSFENHPSGGLIDGCADVRCSMNRPGSGVQNMVSSAFFCRDCPDSGIYG